MADSHTTIFECAARRQGTAGGNDPADCDWPDCGCDEVQPANPQATEAKPPHPLLSDRETRLFRYVTHDDIVRWERLEMRYENLLTTLRQALGDQHGQS